MGNRKVIVRNSTHAITHFQGNFNERAIFSSSSQILLGILNFNFGVPADYKMHDKQGAVCEELIKETGENGFILLLTDRYCIVSPRSNPKLESLTDIEKIHASYPTHPAFKKPHDEIEKITKI